MITAIAGMPAGTIGFEARGTVTSEDYENVLVPAVTTAMEAGPVRLLYVLGDDFTGASAAAALQRIRRINPKDARGVPRARIHAIGFPTQQAGGGDRHLYAGRTRFITEAMAAHFEPVAWPPAGEGAPAAQAQGPVMQVRARARAAWR